MRNPEKTEISECHQTSSVHKSAVVKMLLLDAKCALPIAMFILSPIERTDILFIWVELTHEPTSPRSFQDLSLSGGF
jgi:hypothetical protein